MKIGLCGRRANLLWWTCKIPYWSFSIFVNFVTMSSLFSALKSSSLSGYIPSPIGDPGGGSRGPFHCHAGGGAGGQFSPGFEQPQYPAAAGGERAGFSPGGEGSQFSPGGGSHWFPGEAGARFVQGGEHQFSPGGTQCSPGGGTNYFPSGANQYSPNGTNQYSPKAGGQQFSPGGIGQYSPGGVAQYSPSGGTQHCPFPGPGPLVNQYSPGGAQCSPGGAQYSPGGSLYSPGVGHNSPGGSSSYSPAQYSPGGQYQYSPTGSHYSPQGSREHSPGGASHHSSSGSQYSPVGSRVHSPGGGNRKSSGRRAHHSPVQHPYSSEERGPREISPGGSSFQKGEGLLLSPEKVGRSFLAGSGKQEGKVGEKSKFPWLEGRVGRKREEGNKFPWLQKVMSEGKEGERPGIRLQQASKTSCFLLSSSSWSPGEYRQRFAWSWRCEQRPGRPRPGSEPWRVWTLGEFGLWRLKHRLRLWQSIVTRGQLHLFRTNLSPARWIWSGPWQQCTDAEIGGFLAAFPVEQIPLNKSHWIDCRCSSASTLASLRPAHSPG